VNDYGVRAGLGEKLDEIFRGLDHEMGLDDQACKWAQAPNGQHTESDIGNKSAVHYIHLESVNSSVFECQHLLTQTSEIR
jgi:hypothetical protein